MMKPFFTSSDTGSSVYLLDGDPLYLEFDPGNGNPIMITVRDILEIYKLMNAIWYSGRWKYLGICVSGGCPNKPSHHIRQTNCPALTDYEQQLYNDNLSRMRGLHMEENRPPIANGETSDNS